MVALLISHVNTIRSRMIQNTRERVLRKVPNGCLKISFNTSCTGKWPLKFPFNSIFDDLGRHSFANSLARVAICFAFVRRFVSKLSPYLQSSFDLEEKHKILRSKGAHNSQGITTRKRRKIDSLSFSACGADDE